MYCYYSLSSAGLQHLFLQYDDYCRKRSITFKVNKSICMFFKSEVNNKSDTTMLFVSGRAIDFVQEIKISRRDTEFSSNAKILCTSQYTITKL